MTIRPQTRIERVILATAIALILLAAVDTVAAADRLLIGGWSTHLVSKDTTNSDHRILAVETGSVVAGYFQNSYGRPTWFVNRAWRWPDVWGVKHLEALAGVGISYGYRGCWGDSKSASRLCPDGVVGLAWTQWRVVPSIKLKGDAVVFSPEVKF